jgi:hypothetical protein
MPTLVAATESISGDEAFHCEGQRDECAGDRGGAGAAIGFDYVAIDPDGLLAEGFLVGHRAQGAADEALNFKRAATLLAARSFASRALLSGARQHTVFARDPAFASAFQKRRDAVIDGSRTNHPGFAQLNQDAAFSLGNEIRHDLHSADLVGSTPVASHESSQSRLLGCNSPEFAQAQG